MYAINMDEDRRAAVEQVIGKGMVKKLSNYFSGVFEHLFEHLSLGKLLFECAFDSINLMDTNTGGITLLVSESGCKAQLPHADYNHTLLQAARRVSEGSKNEPMTQNQVPLSALFALEDCTLQVWPGALLLKKQKGHWIDRKQISLKQGQLIVFRGDLVHAGSAYSSLNLRLHFYLDHPKVDRSGNSTQPVGYDGHLANINK